MITPKERVYAAVAHEETDIVPYTISIHPRAHQLLAGIYGQEYNKDIINHLASSWPLTRLFPHMGESFQYVDISEIEHQRRYLLDAGFPQEEVEGYFAAPDKPWIDDFGCVWLQSADGAPHVIKCPLKEPNLKGYEFPDYSNPLLYKHIPKEIEKNEDRFFVGGAGLLFFERAWALRGFQQILIDFYRHPDFVEELLDNLMELNIQMVKAMTQFDVDAVLFSDDYGMQKGLLSGPRMWRKFLKPRLQKIYSSVKKAGKLVMIHSCGDNSEIMGDLIEIGVDIFNPTQPEAMDIYELKSKWGSQVTFDGGIPSQKLPFCSPEEIREVVIKTRSIMSKGGGYILSPTKEIRWDAPPETAMTLIREIVHPSQK